MTSDPTDGAADPDEGSRRRLTEKELFLLLLVGIALLMALSGFVLIIN